MWIEIFFSAGASVAMSYFLCVVFTEQRSCLRRIAARRERVRFNDLSHYEQVKDAPPTSHVFHP